MSRAARRAFTMTETLVVGAVTAGLIGLLLPALSSAIANSQASTCRNNLSRLAQALNAYHDAQGKFPPGMQFPVPAIGHVCAEPEECTDQSANWVIVSLPYLGEQALYDQFDLRALRFLPGGITNITTTNGAATATDLPVMQCPADAYSGAKYQVQRSTGGTQSYGRGNYGANSCLMEPWYYEDGGVGDAAPSACGGPDQIAWAPSPNTSENYWWKTRGVMGLDASVSRSQITDGTSNTILIGEIRAGVNSADPRGVWAMGTSGSSTLWTQRAGPNPCNPGDDELSNSAGPATILAAGDPVNGAGGPHPHLLAECMDVADFSYFRAVISNFRSQHAGGILVAMADASVRFISNNVERGPNNSYTYWNPGTADMLTWERLNASADGLPIDMNAENSAGLIVPFVLGDMNGDGVCDNFDIAAFELALTDPAAYQALYPQLTDYQQRGDINQDGSFDNLDIGPFEEFLAAAQQSN